MTKILIIEDDPLVAKMYQKVLTFEGFMVEVAEEGREGLIKAETGKPDLILLDIMMPKMHGLEVLDRLKANPVLKSIPVVILTNLSGAHDARVGLQKGAVAYLVKSEYKPEEVADKIKEILAGQARVQPASTEEQPISQTPSTQPQPQKEPQN